MVGTKVIDVEFGLWGIIWQVKSAIRGIKYVIRWCDGSVDYSVYAHELQDWGYVLQ